MWRFKINPHSWLIGWLMLTFGSYRRPSSSVMSGSKGVGGRDEVVAAAMMVMVVIIFHSLLPTPARRKVLPTLIIHACTVCIEVSQDMCACVRACGCAPTHGLALALVLTRGEGRGSTRGGRARTFVFFARPLARSSHLPPLVRQTLF